MEVSNLFLILLDPLDFTEVLFRILLRGSLRTIHFGKLTVFQLVLLHLGDTCVQIDDEELRPETVDLLVLDHDRGQLLLLAVAQPAHVHQLPALALAEQVVPFHHLAQVADHLRFGHCTAAFVRSDHYGYVFRHFYVVWVVVFIIFLEFGYCSNFIAG